MLNDVHTSKPDHYLRKVKYMSSSQKPVILTEANNIPKKLSLERHFFQSLSVLQLNFLRLSWVYTLPFLLLPALLSPLSPLLLFSWAALCSVFISFLGHSVFCSPSDCFCSFISGFCSCLSLLLLSQKPSIHVGWTHFQQPEPQVGCCFTLCTSFDLQSQLIPT